MLGMTVSDAIAFGMMILACLAAWRGIKSGNSERKVNPPEQTLSLGSAVFADTAIMKLHVDAINAQTLAVDRLTEAIGGLGENRERHRTDRLADLMERLSEVLDDRDRNHRGGRGR